MFSSILKMVGLGKPDSEQTIIRIGAELMVAGYQELVDRAVADNDRVAHLHIIRALLYGAPGIVRCPADAQAWAGAAAARSPKVQIIEYAQKLIPAAGASDAYLVKQGHGTLLQAANAGDAAARSQLGALLVEAGRQSRGDIVYTVGDGDLHLEGKGALHYQRAIEWYWMADDAGDASAMEALAALEAELMARGTPAPARERAVPPAAATERPTAAPARRRPTAAHARAEAPAPAPTDNRDFLVRRANRSYSVYERTPSGLIEILGGRLPKQMNLPDGYVRYDGSWPQRVAMSGGRSRFKTDGNIQVMYRHPDAAHKYVWIAKFVDVYNLY